MGTLNKLETIDIVYPISGITLNYCSRTIDEANAKFLNGIEVKSFTSSSLLSTSYSSSINRSITTPANTYKINMTLFSTTGSIVESTITCFTPYLGTGTPTTTPNP